TLKDVKEATGIWNSSASVSLMTLEKKGHLVRISRGLYRLAEPVKTPDPVSFEDVVYKIKQFEGAEFTVSDIRSKFISHIRPSSEQVRAVLSRLVEGQLVASLGNGYYSQILVTNNDRKEENEVKTEDIPVLEQGYPDLEIDAALTTGGRLQVDAEGNIWVVTRVLVGNIHSPSEESE
ncbi:MAG: hypothetical protein ACREOB_01935, partial [Thermodesulfobacteriota bacterium]